VWYLAEILFAEPRQDGRAVYQCESSNVLISAATAAEAYGKAVDWGRGYAAEPPATMALLGASRT
jgi:hypothetical protein